MSPTVRQSEEQAQVREKILAAARDLFVLHGFEAVSLRKIAEAIGYTAPALYTHFKDKSKILEEICRRDFDALAGAFNKLAQIEDPVRRIYRSGLAYIRFAREHPNHYRLMFMTPNLGEIAPPGPEDIELMKDPDRDAYAFLLAAVRQAVADGRLRKEFADADLAAQTLWAGVHGLASLEITHRTCPWADLRPIDKLSRVACAALIRGMLADPTELEHLR